MFDMKICIKERGQNVFVNVTVQPLSSAGANSAQGRCCDFGTVSAFSLQIKNLNLVVMMHVVSL
jgi:hypothetical protein